MKNANISIIVFASWVLFSCTSKIYPTNGETIYKTGKNLQGEKLLNKKESWIKFVNNCQTCHGKNGDKMKTVSIKFSYLADPENFAIPYNDSLLFRFIDDDLTSDGRKANIGVIWKMNDSDKKDLLEYLKTL